MYRTVCVPDLSALWGDWNLIELKNVSFEYENGASGALKDVSIQINAGECVLICGESGCGKTTITRLVNGLIPHYYEGNLSGSVSVGKLDITTADLSETARYVGSVFQNPRSQFFCVDTTSEIAFGCENAGLLEEDIRQRVWQAAKELKMEHLLGRNIFELSGGEKQKVACASVSAEHPEVFVLDEPTSNLDTDAIEDLKKTLLLWKSQGKTILIAEHRLYWLKEICDRVIYMKDGKVLFDLSINEFLQFSQEQMENLGLRTLSPEKLKVSGNFVSPDRELLLKNFNFSYKNKDALQIPSLSLPVGGIIAVIGHNGAGKSTFSNCLCGLKKHFKGNIVVDKEKLGRRKLLKKCYMVMQDVNHQLFCETVEDEVELGMDKADENAVKTVLTALGLFETAKRHPMSLSGGQKQRVAVASAILADKQILIFDEPTSGLDYKHMEQTAELIASLQGKKTVFIVTHDPELIVRCCTHILHLENGMVVENYALNEKTVDKLTRFFSNKS